MKYGRPEIMNTDQGSQFTSAAFIGLLQEQSIQVSMDGKGCWRDNVFVERLWKSVKYEEIYLHGYDTVSDVRQALSRHFDFYNRRRPHSALTGKPRIRITSTSRSSHRLNPQRVHLENRKFCPAARGHLFPTKGEVRPRGGK
jgi:transposase InsO family protein